MRGVWEDLGHRTKSFRLENVSQICLCRMRICIVHEIV